MEFKIKRDYETSYQPLGAGSIVNSAIDNAVLKSLQDKIDKQQRQNECAALFGHDHMQDFFGAASVVSHEMGNIDYNDFLNLCNKVKRDYVQKLNIIAIPMVIRVRVKEHNKKTWMRESYHRRIQKKWDKRYGFKWIENPTLPSPGDVFFMENENKLLVRADEEQRIVDLLA